MDQPITSGCGPAVYAALVALNTFELIVLAVMTRRNQRADAERRVLLDYVADERGQGFVDEKLSLERSRRGNGHA